MPEQLPVNEEYHRMEEGFDASQKRLSSAFDAIFAKYGNPENEDDGDIIDLNTGEIVEDRGHLKSLETQKGLWQKVMGGDYDDEDDEDDWVTFREERVQQQQEQELYQEEQGSEIQGNECTPPKKVNRKQKMSNRRKLTTPVTKSNWLLDDDAFDNLLTPTTRKRGTKRRISHNALRSPSVRKMMEEESDDDTMLLTPIRRRHSSFSHATVPRNEPPSPQASMLLSQEDEPRDEGPTIDLLSSPEPDPGQPSSNNQVLDIQQTNSNNTDNDADDNLMTNNDDDASSMVIVISDDEADNNMAQPPDHSNDSNHQTSGLTAETPPTMRDYFQGPTVLQRLFSRNPFGYADFKQQERLRIMNES